VPDRVQAGSPLATASLSSGTLAFRPMALSESRDATADVPCSPAIVPKDSQTGIAKNSEEVRCK
jgi:hypothetical protein